MIDRIKIAVHTAIIALAIFITWYATSDHYKVRINQIQLQIAEATNTELQARADALAEQLEKNRKGAIQHEKERRINDDLRQQLERLRITQICGPAMQGTAETGTGGNSGAGILSARVDEEFARLQSRAGQLFERCDKLNIDVRRVNVEQ